MQKRFFFGFVLLFLLVLALKSFCLGIRVASFTGGLSIRFYEVSFESDLDTDWDTALKKFSTDHHPLFVGLSSIFPQKSQELFEKVYVNIDSPFSFKLRIQKVESVKSEDLFGQILAHEVVVFG